MPDNVSSEAVALIEPAEGFQPWKRQAGESTLWFERFTLYRKQGTRRTLLGAVNAYKAKRSQRRTDDIPGAWRNAFAVFKWRERAQAWDDHQAAIDEARWEKRRREVRDVEWELSESLIEKARQMLQFPLATTERTQDDNGRQVTTIVKPARWTMRDAASVIKVSSELKRLASNMPTATARTEVTGANGERLIPSRNLDTLTDEELMAIAALALPLVRQAQDKGQGKGNDATLDAGGGKPGGSEGPPAESGPQPAD
jgi:hypothetical protein